MQSPNFLQNQAIFPAFFSAKDSFSTTSQFLTQQTLSNDSLIQKQNNKEHVSTFEVDMYFSSSDQQQAVSPVSTSHSRTCSEQNNQKFSHLAPTSKKISKDFNKIGKRTLVKAKKRLRRDLWKPKEDEMLLELIGIYGLKWTVIGQQIGGRTGKQVRDRYTNYLKPGINSNSCWSTEEDEKFISLYFQFGNKWSHIAKFLPGRSECQVKNRFHSYIKEVLSINRPKENTITISKSNSYSEKTGDKKAEMVQIPVDCQEHAIEVSNKPHEESTGSYKKGKQDEDFEIFLNKFFEKEKVEQEISQYHTLNDYSCLNQDYPQFLLNFKGENNNFLDL